MSPKWLKPNHVDNQCKYMIWGLPRCWCQMLETVYVGDNFQIFETDYIDVRDFYIEMVGNTRERSPTSLIWVLYYGAVNLTLNKNQTLLVLVHSQFKKLYTKMIYTRRLILKYLILMCTRSQKISNWMYWIEVWKVFVQLH